MYKEEKELWVKFACAALAGSAKTVGERYLSDNNSKDPENSLTERDIVEDDCSIAADYATEMVRLFMIHFNGC